jgi:hypothetical protein
MTHSMTSTGALPVAASHVTTRCPGTTVDVRDEFLVKLLAGMGEPEFDRR